MTIHSIYRIDVGDRCYIGRTKNFYSRMCGHYSEYETVKKITRKLHKAIRDLGWDCVTSYEIARYDVNNCREANILEMLWMNRCKSQLNMLNKRKSFYKNIISKAIDIESRGLITDPCDLQVVTDFREHYEKTMCDYVFDKLLDEIDDTSKGPSGDREIIE